MFSQSEGSLRRTDVQDRRLSIIDVSCADDSLLDPISENPLNHQSTENEEQSELWYTPNSKKFEDAATKIQQWEQERQTSEAGKSKKNNTKCNLRKSLAWDSAFFTSAGVLDAEELSSIMEGAEKEELPRIEEDVYKSCDSISTLASDSLTLESVDMEGDLFEDVRASIQKSNNKSKLANAPTRFPSVSGVSGFQIRDSSKKVGSMVSRNKTKAQPALKNPSAGIRGIGKMTTKNNSISTQLPPSVATRRESSISKQSKVPVRPIASSTISSKRASLGDLHHKSEKDKAKHIVGERVSSVSKASVTGGSRGIVPRPTILPKSTSGPSVSMKTKSAISTSSGSNLSDNIGKSPCNSSKRKVNNGTLKPPTPRAPVRTPSRFSSRSNTESGNSSLSSMMSSNKFSSSISPASSVSDLSSESSVSTSMPKRMCDSSRSSIDSSSSSKVLSDTVADQGINSQILQSDSSLNGQEAQHTGFVSQSVRNTSVATVIPPAPGKPSGLRLPSPKIGFFDGAKSSVRTPRGGVQPQSAGPHGLLKQGAGSPSSGQNKAKLGKLQPVRNITPIGNKKSENQLNSHPTHFHESLDVAIKTSNADQNVKTSSEMLMGAVEYTSPSHPVEKTHNLHPPMGVNKPENVHDIQVDCLSKQVELMDINSKTCEKINGELSSQSELSDHPKNQESLKGSSTPCISVSPTRFDMGTSLRRPFAVKDSFCNMDCSVFTESIVSEVKPTDISVSESITKETAETN